MIFIKIFKYLAIFGYYSTKMYAVFVKKSFMQQNVLDKMMKFLQTLYISEKIMYNKIVWEFLNTDEKTRE